MKVMDSLPIATQGESSPEPTWQASRALDTHALTRISLERTNGSHSSLNVKFLEVRNNTYANMSNRHAGNHSSGNVKSSVVSALPLSSLTTSLS